MVCLRQILQVVKRKRVHGHHPFQQSREKRQCMVVHVLMMHHRKHDQWFQPGGHADGDADILRVALRETVEETGLESGQVRLLSSDVFDVDIHTIPAIGDEPQHEHIDIRFLVEIDDSHDVPGNDESHEVSWVDLHNVSRFNNNRSTYRMVEKTRLMRNLYTDTKIA